MEPRPSKRIAWLCTVAMYSLMAFESCKEKEEVVDVVAAVSFAEGLQTITEGENATVKIILDKPAPKNSWIEITVESNAIYDQHYTTNPVIGDDNRVMLPISRGKKSVELSLSSIDNTKYEGSLFIVLSISSDDLTDGLEAGSATTHTLTIYDDEGPSIADFQGSAFRLGEEEENGILIRIPFSRPAEGEGSITISLDPGSAVINTDFTIDQTLDGDSFSFNIVKDDSVVTFKVWPIDDDLYKGNSAVRFSIADVSGVIKKGVADEYLVTLIDDEEVSIAQFDATSGSIEEASTEGIRIDILLSTPLKGTGTLLVQFLPKKAVYGTDFTTLPAAEENTIAFDLAYDQTSVSFTVFPIDDDLFTGDLLIPIRISGATGPTIPGGSREFKLSIDDDEGPAVATFALSSATLTEGSGEELEVIIDFSVPVPGTGTIEVEVDGYYEQFTSDPPVSKYSGSSTSGIWSVQNITLDVPQYAQTTSFKVRTVDDDVCLLSQNVTFKILSVTGPIEKGEQDEFDLTIVGNEPHTLVTVRTAQATVYESSPDGQEVVLDFSPAAVVPGRIVVIADPYTEFWSDRITTEPEIVWYSSHDTYGLIDYPAGAASVSFRILPNDDNVAGGNFTEVLSFVAQPNDNSCYISDDQTYTFSFIDDDGE